MASVQLGLPRSSVNFLMGQSSLSTSVYPCAYVVLHIDMRIIRKVLTFGSFFLFLISAVAVCARHYHDATI